MEGEFIYKEIEKDYEEMIKEDIEIYEEKGELEYIEDERKLKREIDGYNRDREGN